MDRLRHAVIRLLRRTTFTYNSPVAGSYFILFLILLQNGAPWRSGYAAVCKTAYTGSIPVGASRIFNSFQTYMAYQGLHVV